ncbi:Clock-associated two-component sensor histidine kinase SasA [Richelia intracellularis HH01]|jgi:two-component system clock-associated histidine kinase SasA|uniref:Adaptive-response sensory-kinase SasA n=1 Tax=Richelia intracellularis HH01 TaxID=1165094 RepID=M1X4T5_9NOST|nr:histidine kinase [Richelia intracellularis]CCH66651.1 Clock-associated two-component sensor histidine kinase SasA [Richelia intracellularis HH01]
MQVSQDTSIYFEAPLQLLLFIDGRSKSRQEVQQIRSYLSELQAIYDFELQTIDVGKQPYLAEHFKLVATPALIKIQPEPRQILAGSTIITQLKIWWPRWQTAVEAYLKLHQNCQDLEEPHHTGSISLESLVLSRPSSISSVAVSEELIRLSDEIFCLKQEKEKLQEQLQFKDRVIAMLAHDLRNPLTAAAIAIDTLKSNYNVEKGEFSRLSPKMVMHLFKQSRNQVQIMNRMITDLLKVGHSKDRKFPIQPQKLEIGQLCLDTIYELCDSYMSKSITIEKDIPKDLPYVYADPERIHQVLINLFDNAIKYTPANGRICISALHRTTQKVQCSISDTGPGIPEDNREQIFENRFRLERDKKQDGYGIGLSFCQRIIQAHFGRIWVESTPNGGALFHFTLPVYPD